MSAIVSLFSSHALTLAVGFLLTTFAVAIGGGATSAVRRRRVAKATHLGFLTAQAVEGELPAGTSLAVAEKVAEALSTADEWMTAHGWRELTDAEKAQASVSLRAAEGAVVVGSPL